MRAAWFDKLGPASEVFQIGDIDKPIAGPGEVLVKVYTSGINPGDAKTRSGWQNVHDASGTVIPHADGAGVIENVGIDVNTSRIGQRVWIHHSPNNGMGTAADYIAIPEDRARLLPDDCSFAEGACLGVPALTAHKAVLVDGTIDGQTHLISGGAGAVGQYAIQFARQGGATVIATVSSDEKADIARTCGADHIINYKTEDVTAQAMKITQGEGVDRIIEVDFGANILTDAEIIKPHGVIASYSSTSEREPVFPYYPVCEKGRCASDYSGIYHPDRRKAGKIG